MTCSSDPTSGCSNDEIVAEISSCCEETNTNLTSIAAKLEAINTTQVSCCESITSKMDTIIGHLATIAAK